MPSEAPTPTRTRREELLSIAAKLFAERGFKNTTVRDIADAAGILSGSLYHHFPGKEALFWAVLEEVGARITRQGEDIARDAPDPVAMLRAGALAWIRLAGDPVVPGNFLKIRNTIDDPMSENRIAFVKEMEPILLIDAANLVIEMRGFEERIGDL